MIIEPPLDDSCPICGEVCGNFSNREVWCNNYDPPDVDYDDDVDYYFAKDERYG